MIYVIQPVVVDTPVSPTPYDNNGSREENVTTIPMNSTLGDMVFSDSDFIEPIDFGPDWEERLDSFCYTNF